MPEIHVTITLEDVFRCSFMLLLVIGAIVTALIRLYKEGRNKQS